MIATILVEIERIFARLCRQPGWNPPTHEGISNYKSDAGELSSNQITKGRDSHFEKPGKCSRKPSSRNKAQQ